MLKNILSIHGEHGLFKLVSQSPKMVVVESIIDGKRKPVFLDKKIISLGDIAMYTESEEKPLNEVMQAVYDAQKGAKLDIDVKTADAEELRTWFGTVVADFDRDRVYPSDIKKLILWYNQLIEAGITDFSAEEENK